MMSEAPYSRRAFLTRMFRGREALRTERLQNAPRVAEIQPWLCLAHRGQGCSACGEHCPLPGAVVREAGLPRIDPTVCDGCGKCAEVCPAPLNAVHVKPRRH